MRAALAAGWRRADLEWERVEEAALAAGAAGDAKGAARLWRRGWSIARRFAADDPRRAMALANAGLADLLSGRIRRAARRRVEARRLWAEVPRWIETANLRPLARSSLFHLRMEARHRATYAAAARRPLLASAAEVRARLDRTVRGDELGARLDRTSRGDELGVRLERWRRERPPVHDDRRKLVAAVLLLAD